MQGVGKIASLLLTSAAACALLTACHGSDDNTGSITPPTVGAFTCPVIPYTTANTTAGIAVTCTSTGALSADGNAVTYNWNFGDQTPTGSTQPTSGNGVTHYYAQPGTYQVVLQIVDDHGTSADRAEFITVGPVNPSVTADGVQNWAWLSGSKAANVFGVYQTEFTAAPLNQPGARQSGASWTSLQGNLWMFGGSGYDSTGTPGYLNDLWSFNTTTNQWTWVSGSNKVNALGTFPATFGIASATNIISARSAAATWIDPATGNFWLFGGNGYDKNAALGYLNDLWMLNSQTGEPTLVAGSGIANSPSVLGVTNSPSGRSYASTWVGKNGVFWLFGGQAVNSAGAIEYLNDLWSFDPSQPGWKLVSASTTLTTVNTSGAYGTAVGTTGNPGARVSAQTWADASGNLWLFGGSGFDGVGALGALNDLWMYNTTTNTWTWIAGSSTANAASVYGSSAEGSAVALSGSTPGARVGTSGWVDSANNFWLFGGSGLDSTSTTTANDGGGALNELWSFNTTTKLWAFMGGVNVAGTAGVYTSQTANPSSFSIYNSPGSRVWGTSWSVNGNFYLFGGSGLDSIGTSGYLNDLWTVKTVAPTN